MAKKASEKRAKQPATAVRVKTAPEVVGALNRYIDYFFHKKIGKSLGKRTQQKLVSYGPWLMTLILLIVLPELLIFAKNAEIVGISGFFTEIFFNQESWILLIVVLSNCLLLADGLSDLFNKKLRGWNRIYLALLINMTYIAAQLAQNLSRPAAPLLSLAAICVLLFMHLDIKKYYK